MTQKICFQSVMDMKIVNILAPPMAANCWLCWDGASRLAVLIDPPSSSERIDEILAQNGLTICHILLTHGHFDHIFGADVLRDEYNVPVAIHEADAQMLTDPMKNASALFFREDHIYRPAEILLRDREEIPVGESLIRVIHTPGHTPGSVCFAMDKDYITGDTLFRGSIGRTDLPGGSWQAMRHTLDRLSELPDGIRIYPGHGDPSDMAYEKKHNPYL